MSRLIKELKLRRKLVEKLDFNDFSASLNKIHTWLLNQNELEPILDRLEEVAKSSGVFENLNYFRGPTISSLEEQAVVGYRICENCFPNTNIWDIAKRYKIIDYDVKLTTVRAVKKLKDKYILPFLDFLIAEVDNIQHEVTLDAEIHFRLKTITTERFKSQYRSTTKMIDKISKSLSVSDEEGIWNGIANSCRDLLIIFAKELRRYNVIEESTEFKLADFRNTLKVIVGAKGRKGRFQSTLFKLIDSIWEHSNSATHKSDLTKQQAIRIFVWSIMIIYEVENYIYEIEAKIK